jgi:hypothetical protein
VVSVRSMAAQQPHIITQVVGMLLDEQLHQQQHYHLHHQKDKDSQQHTDGPNTPVPAFYREIQSCISVLLRYVVGMPAFGASNPTCRSCGVDVASSTYHLASSTKYA